MRKINVVDWAGAFALVSISVLFFIWACKILLGVEHHQGWDWNAFAAWGTWVAGIATVGAVVVSLFLAKQVDRKEQQKDYVRARMTALRYVGSLSELHIKLNFVEVWAEDRMKALFDGSSEHSNIERIADLALAVTLEDLVLLAPIKGNFAIRLHTLSLLLTGSAAHAGSVNGALIALYDALNSKDSTRIGACDSQLEMALSNLGKHVRFAKEILIPLLHECGSVAYDASSWT